MKLWQKVFLCTLVLVIAAVDITALLMLNSMHRMTVERERERGVQMHEYAKNTMKSNVLFSRLTKNKVKLDEQSVFTAVESLSLDQGGFSLYRSGKRSMEKEGRAIDTELALIQLTQQDVRHTELVEENGKEFLLVESSLTLEGETYQLVTNLDVTEVFVLRKKQLEYISQMSILCAAASAGVLIIVVWLLLRPLGRVNQQTREIAQGRYDKRLRVQGGGELSQLSENMNTMAEAIEENICHLEQVANDRKTFIANLTHEMKTPLTSILGFADILRVKRNVNEEERREYAGVIVEEAKRLRSLSSKLMELITVGNTQMEKKIIRTDVLLQEVETSLSPLMAERGIVLRVSCLPFCLCGDVELLKSLLYNLLDNASKASADGDTVELESGQRGSEDCIWVRDHGVGMTKEALASAKKPFYMVDKARTRQEGGAGLGLALCAEIAKLHHAALLIESEPGIGTCVTIAFKKEVL